MESTISQQDTLLPDQFLRDPNLCSALAWDNFGVNISTLSVADSMHLTFGICYQNESQTSKEIPKRDDTVRKKKSKILQRFFGMNKHKKPNPTEKSQECHTFSLKTLYFILRFHLFRALVLTHFGRFPSIFSQIYPCGPDGMVNCDVWWILCGVECFFSNWKDYRRVRGTIHFIRKWCNRNWIVTSVP